MRAPDTRELPPAQRTLHRLFVGELLKNWSELMHPDNDGPHQQHLRRTGKLAEIEEKLRAAGKLPPDDCT
jgi:hypothetical protein